MNIRAAKEVRVELAERAYAVHVGAGLITSCGELLAALGPASRVVVITNPRVASLYGRRLCSSIEPTAGGNLAVIEIPDGEQHKTLATVEHIYDAVLAEASDRSLVIVALGGGVVGDVAGFAAATLLRGLRLVMVPTTLLAQVDSSVGGKTGVNRREGKNLVGAFYQPSLVVSDPETLGTLSAREYRAGLAEVVKYGMVLDESLFELLEQHKVDILGRDSDLLTEIIARCVGLKARVVEQDEIESGLRRVLNFGHTVGHAIEQATEYKRFLHGEAIAMGMVASVRVAHGLGSCEASLAGRLIELLEAFGLEAEVPEDIKADKVERAIAFDKKLRQEEVAFIVNRGIGHSAEHMLSPRAIREALWGGKP